MLENLQMHFEDEKAALLSALHQHSDAKERERERQHALVKLQRDRQLLQAEEKLDSAALIFSMGQQQQADRQERFVSLTLPRQTFFLYCWCKFLPTAVFKRGQENYTCSFRDFCSI